MMSVAAMLQLYVVCMSYAYGTWYLYQGHPEKVLKRDNGKILGG